MAKLVWDQVGEKLFETGIDRGVLYPVDEAGKYNNGEPWNGLTAFNESPSGAEPTALYANNRKYLNLMSAEEFGGTLEAYTYPAGFAACNGEAELVSGIVVAQQDRKMFGFAYRTMIGNDVKGTDYGYKIHLVYGCLASPSEKEHNTINEDPEAETMSWEIATTPVDVTGFKPTAHLIIDSTKVSESGLAALEEALYGTDDKEAYLPLPDEVVTLVGSAA